MGGAGCSVPPAGTAVLMLERRCVHPPQKGGGTAQELVAGIVEAQEEARRRAERKAQLRERCVQRRLL